MKAFCWNDEWILAHKDEFATWAKMCKEYNKVFNTEFTRQQFKWHTNQSLGLRLSDYKYTTEQDNWLKNNYSLYMLSDLHEHFNKVFDTNKSCSAIKEHCRLLGLKLNKEEKYKRALYGQEYSVSKKRMPIGTIGRPANGYLLIKTENGWEYLTKYLLKQKGIEVCNDEQTVFLDGDKTNYDPNNLEVMPIKFAPIMMQNKFFSEHPAITKTGIKWCELYQVLKESGLEVEDETEVCCL